MPCLSVSAVPPGDSPFEDPGGCASPDLVITNHCVDALTISDMNVAVVGDDGGTLCPDASSDPTRTINLGCDYATIMVRPGMSLEIEVNGFGPADYIVPASLGSQSLNLGFTTH
jgi:hypothetical protein